MLLGILLLLAAQFPCPPYAHAGQAQHLAAQEIEHGYALLLQAQAAADAAQRQERLTDAVETFKHAYQTYGHSTKVQALLGAAQAYLHMPPVRRSWLFFWQATSLQRAEKALIQTLFLQPDNSAAALLLGLVYRRLAAQESAPRAMYERRSRQYLQQAARGGLPLWLHGAAEASEAAAVTPYHPGARLILLRYIDALGSGAPENLVFVYSAGTSEELWAVVLVQHTAHPLSRVVSGGRLAPGGTLLGLRSTAGSRHRPLLQVRIKDATGQRDLHFTWAENGFVFTGVQPVAP